MPRRSIAGSRRLRKHVPRGVLETLLSRNLPNIRENLSAASHIHSPNQTTRSTGDAIKRAQVKRSPATTATTRRNDPCDRCNDPSHYLRGDRCSAPFGQL